MKSSHDFPLGGRLPAAVLFLVITISFGAVAAGSGPVPASSAPTEHEVKCGGLSLRGAPTAGGGVSVAGTVRLSGSIGAFGAGRSQVSTHVLTSGIAPAAPPAHDARVLFCSGFE